MKLINQLYGNNCDTKAIMQRYENLRAKHCKHFNCGITEFFSSSGRLEIIGNHTDHNNGRAITCAIENDIIAAVSVSDNNLIKICTKGYRDIVVDVNNIDIYNSEKLTTIALVRGIVAGFVNNGFNVGGFNATIDSNVFKGSGVSSSAAFELIIAKIISVLFNGDSVTKLQLALISQYSENNYFGKSCGLLDQCAIAYGGLIEIDFCDTLNPTITSLSHLDDTKTIVLIKTPGGHTKLTGEYSKICDEMKQVAQFFNKQTLRQVEYKQFCNNIKKLSDTLSGRAILRAKHYFDENIRVELCKNALLNEDYKLFYDSISSSGMSSYTLLQNCYTQFDIKQAIPIALMTAKLIDNDCIARVHGGGFNGTILCWVDNAKVQNFVNKMSEIYGQKNVNICGTRSIGVCHVKNEDIFDS